jgi:hypothetical protein
MSYIKNAGIYPYLADLINNGGGLNMEYVREMGITAVAFDEGGTIWEGKKHYDSIEALLDDAESGIKKWVDENW